MEEAIGATSTVYWLGYALPKQGSGNSAAQEATMKKDLGSVVNRGHTVRGG